MRMNEPVTQQPVRVPPGANILSTTDVKGRITHVNDEFVKISGFTRDELIGEAHNIVRHPDMPRLAFEEFWGNLRNGRSWLGLVKNRCKNGDHYWVKAYATPIQDASGNTVEYQSIRTAPPDEACIHRAESAYARLRRREPRKGAIGSENERPLRLGLHWQLVLLFVVSTLPITIAAVTDAAATAGALAWVAGATVAATGALVLTAPLRRIVRSARSRIDDPLMEHVFTGGNNEFASLELLHLSLDSELDAVGKRLADAIRWLEEVAQVTATGVSQVSASIRNQSSETEQVATATEQMSQTVQEVARHAAEADQAAERVHAVTEQGRAIADQSNAGIESLSERLANSRTQVDRLAAGAESIETVLEAIRGITEQTGLLALNASIEAARAGDAGRGFAVVADEVRALAGKTRHSTSEIKDKIDELQVAVRDVIELMTDANEQAERNRELSGQSLTALAEVQQAAADIRNVNARIASATEEQSATSGQIAQSLAAISELAGQVLAGAGNVENQTSGLVEEVTQIRGLVNRFAQRNV